MYIELRPGITMIYFMIQEKPLKCMKSKLH